MTEPRPSPRLAPLLAVLSLAGCRGHETRNEEKVVSAIVHGQYERALEEARRLAEANPNDPEAVDLFREAQLAFLLDGGRKAVFRGDLNLGLELFQKAAALAPEHPSVAAWIVKARAQLADYWLDRAVEVSGPEHLAEAEAAYERVLQYDPVNAAAIEGLAHVLLLRNYRAGMSKTYFDDGLSSFHQLLLEQAHRSFQVSRRYEENEPATRRAVQVKELMAEERLAQAGELERTGSFFAARNEYRLVLLIDPDNVEGRAGLDRMDRETRATRTLDEADMAMRRGELEKASEALAEADVLTEAQQDDVSLMQSSVVEKRLEDKYLAARNLADDSRFPEAVEAFGALIAEAPEYKDAAARKATLEEFIRQAEEFYAKAVAATDDEIAEKYLMAITVTWPEYKDVQERLEGIEARRADAEKAKEGEQPQTDEGAKPEDEPAAEPPTEEEEPKA